jgi:hypothetical protein
VTDAQNDLRTSLMPYLPGLSELGGVIKIDVKDGGGVAYYADLARGALETAHQRPSIIVRGYIQDVVAFFAGELSAEAGVVTGRLGLSGEATLLFRLGATLQAQGQGRRG